VPAGMWFRWGLPGWELVQWRPLHAVRFSIGLPRRLDRYQTQWLRLVRSPIHVPCAERLRGRHAVLCRPSLHNRVQRSGGLLLRELLCSSRLHRYREGRGLFNRGVPSREELPDRGAVIVPLRHR
jgi:hypothetical protein